MRRNDSTASALVARPLRQGQGWSVGEYLCTAGPDDRPFEERREEFSIAAVIEGTFTYRADTGTAVMHPGAFLFGNSGTCYECGHDHSTGDRFCNPMPDVKGVSGSKPRRNFDKPFRCET